MTIMEEVVNSISENTHRAASLKKHHKLSPKIKKKLIPIDRVRLISYCQFLAFLALPPSISKSYSRSKFQSLKAQEAFPFSIHCGGKTFPARKRRESLQQPLITRVYASLFYFSLQGVSTVVTRDRYFEKIEIEKWEVKIGRPGPEPGIPDPGFILLLLKNREIGIGSRSRSGL
jgi:hypothetical protein